MTARSSQDVIIIGAGVIGCSIARALSLEGLSTLNVDSLPAAGYGSTSHSSAIIRPFYSHVTACAVAHESRACWLDWPDFLGVEDERGFASYVECGGLVLVNEGAESDYAANLEALDAVGVGYRWLDPAELVSMYPGMELSAFGPPRRMEDSGFGEPTSGRIGAGIYLDAAGYVSDPQLAAHNLQVAAVAAGARFRFDAKIVEIIRDEQRVQGVRLASGETLTAPLLVNAAGPHSAQINQLAGVLDQLAIRTEAHRHEVAYLSAPPGYLENGGGFVVDLDSGTYQRPDGGDIVIGTADPDCDAPDVVDPDDYASGFTDQWTLQVYRTAQRYPQLGIENTARGTVGLYDVSDDWIPIYDKTDLEGYYLAIGTSGNQFKNAPLVGDILSQIMLGGTSGVDHDQQSAVLHLPHLDRSVELSFYSRNRELKSTRSVLA